MTHGLINHIIWELVFSIKALNFQQWKVTYKYGRVTNMVSHEK